MDRIRSQGPEGFDIDSTVGAMLESWCASFEKLGWGNRLSLLEQLDEHIEFSARHGGPQLSSRFTAKLIEVLKGEPIRSRDQAYIYLNSDDELHCQVARVWLTIKDPNNPIVQPSRAQRAVLENGKRAAIRHAVDLPSVIVANDSDNSAILRDVSASGARVAVKKMQRPGSRIMLHMPLMEPIAASVVWFASAYVGVSFISQQPGLVGLL